MVHFALYTTIIVLYSVTTRVICPNSLFLRTQFHFCQEIRKNTTEKYVCIVTSVHFISIGKQAPIDDQISVGNDQQIKYIRIYIFTL